jgi:hypothetical protein
MGSILRQRTAVAKRRRSKGKTSSEPVQENNREGVAKTNALSLRLGVKAAKCNRRSFDSLRYATVAQDDSLFLGDLRLAL